MAPSACVRWRVIKLNLRSWLLTTKSNFPLRWSQKSSVSWETLLLGSTALTAFLSSAIFFAAALASAWFEAAESFWCFGLLWSLLQLLCKCMGSVPNILVVPRTYSYFPYLSWINRAQHSALCMRHAHMKLNITSLAGLWRLHHFRHYSACWITVWCRLESPASHNFPSWGLLGICIYIIHYKRLDEHRSYSFCYPRSQ